MASWLLQELGVVTEVGGTDLVKARQNPAEASPWGAQEFRRKGIIPFLCHSALNPLLEDPQDAATQEGETFFAAPLCMASTLKMGLFQQSFRSDKDLSLSQHPKRSLNPGPHPVFTQNSSCTTVPTTSLQPLSLICFSPGAGSAPSPGSAPSTSKT